MTRKMAISTFAVLLPHWQIAVTDWLATTKSSRPRIASFGMRSRG